MSHKLINTGILIAILLSWQILQAGSVASVEQAVKQKVLHYYLRYFKVAPQKLHVDFLRLPSALPSINKIDQIRVSDQHGRLKLGYRTLWVSLTYRSRLIKKFPVSVRTAIESKVLVSKQRIARHAKVTPAMFRPEIRLITADWDKMIFDAGQIAGWESRRVIPAGSALTKDLLRPAPLVHRGQELRAELIAGNLVVEVKAIARDDGVLGDVIPVKALPQGKKLKARVSGAGYVVIEQEP